MKRNLDLIREILLAIEKYEPERIHNLQCISPSDFSGSQSQNLHHIELLLNSGLIEQVGKPTSHPEFTIRGLTMAGHDFLDAVREKSIFEHTKNRLHAAGGWTLDLVLAVAKDEIKRRLFGGAAT